MHGYYTDKLSAEKLRQVYDIAPHRIRQYLRAEVDFVLDAIHPDDTVLELGCGYGRVTEPMAANAAVAVGIDTSCNSLRSTARMTDSPAGHYLCMDAVRMGFCDAAFDVVVCIQNGISAFHVDRRTLIEEALRVTRRGGKALFSSYAGKFWKYRLHWFELQVQHGLLGEIDYDATGDGIIVCKDGFRATTVGPEEFRELTDEMNADVDIEEVDQSSLFCVITKK